MFPRISRRSTVSHVAYLLTVLLVAFFTALSCVFLLSQAARNAPNRGFVRNFNAVVIGAAYVILVGGIGCNVSGCFLIEKGVGCALARSVAGVLPEAADRGA